MRDPAFLFYSSDFLGGVSDLTMEERGQFITLLCLQHQKGELTEKTIRLSVGNVSVDVLGKFSKMENGSLINERLKSEIEKRSNFIDSRRVNGLKGGRPKGSLSKPLGYPTDNLSEDRNKDENNLGIGGAGEKPFEPKLEATEPYKPETYDSLFINLTQRSPGNETILMQNRIDQSKLENLAKTFIEKLKGMEQFRSEKLERSYFLNWIKIELQSKPKAIGEPNYRKL